MSEKRRDLKMMWNSNAVWTNSGYAVEMRDLLWRFIKDGWDTSQIGFWGLQGFPITYTDGPYKDVGGMTVYPRIADDYGSDAMLHHSVQAGSHVVFTMQDVPTINPAFIEQINKAGKVWIPYLPIDQDPIPPAILANLRYAYKIITFSEYGQKALEKEGYTSTLILEGTDPDIMKPMDKLEMRKELGLPLDAFFFGMIAANKENPPRKGFQEALEAFKLFHDNHPEAALFLHTQQLMPTGFPIMDYAKYLGVADRIFYFDAYKSNFVANSWEVVKQLNAMDVHLHPSQTEGFGLTVIEAMACGKPSIVNNCHSMPEMIIPNETGFICKTGKPRFSNQGGFVYPADPTDLHQKMENAYDLLQKKPEKTAKACRDHVLNKYDINTIVKEKWLPFFEELQEELLPQVDKKV